jgi:transcriptional regulator with XRE-family HTH domain
LRANLSRWELARTAGINHSYVTRLESGDRGYPSRQITASLACGLRLSAQEADQFMALAGYLPPSLQKLGGDDTTIAALVAALTDDTLPPEDRANLRAIVEVVCSKWTKGRDK